MNSAEHTPGPWKAGYWSGQCHIPEHRGNHPGGDKCKYDPEFSAMEESEYYCSFVGIASEAPGVNVVWTEYDQLKIRPADARLIAAAPELLEALEAMRETIPVDISYYEHFLRESLPLHEGEQRAYEALKKCESAISKARGTK